MKSSSPATSSRTPTCLEFTGLPQSERYLESDLEQALIDKLREFLLELGKGFAFMARQQRITLDGQHYWIDLVFYNRLTRSFVLIDLKVGTLTHQDLGQMQMYVNYYQREITAPDENPPIGIVLCADKSEAVVRYTLPEDNQQIFASRYKLYLPTESELAAELQRERQAIELDATYDKVRPMSEAWWLAALSWFTCCRNSWQPLYPKYRNRDSTNRKRLRLRSPADCGPTRQSCALDHIRYDNRVFLAHLLRKLSAP